jgi:hypothetical protein
MGKKPPKALIRKLKAERRALVVQHRNLCRRIKKLEGK